VKSRLHFNPATAANCQKDEVTVSTFTRQKDEVTVSTFTRQKDEDDTVSTFTRQVKSLQVYQSKVYLQQDNQLHVWTDFVK